MARRNDNGTGTICQCKDGYWRAKIQIGVSNEGKKIFKSFSAKTKAECKKKLREYRENLAEHKNEVIAKQVALESKPDDNRLAEQLVQWSINVKKKKLKSESLRRLVGIISNHIIPRIGFYMVEELTLDIIQTELIDAMYNDRQSLSSIKKAKSALNNFYKYWIRCQMTSGNGRMYINIVDYVELPSANQFKHKDIRCMNDGQIKQFEEVLFGKNSGGDYNYQMCDLIYLVLNTGIRLGEACALEVGDYNAEDKTLFVRRNVIETQDITLDSDNNFSVTHRYVKVQESPKTDSGYRKLPLNNAACGCMERLISRAQKINKKAKQIAITEQKSLIWPSNLVRTINRIYEAANINLTGMHSLRHTYATALFAQKIDVKTISTLLGHANIQITLDIYVHFNESIKYGNTEGYYFKPYPEQLIAKAG